MAEGDLIASEVVDGQPQFVCGPCQTACCLYPWPDYSTPEYPPTDVPGFIVVNGYTLPFVSPSSTGSNFEYNDGAGHRLFSSDEGQWFYDEDEGPPWTSLCLIGAYQSDIDLPDITVSDLFPSTLLVNDTDTITRTSICFWSASGWLLTYNSSTFKWELNGLPKDDPQSSPVGNYSGNTIS